MQFEKGQKAREEEQVVEGQFEEIDGNSGQNQLDLNQMAYMLIVGRTKNGETIVRTAGTNDLIVADGLANYAKKKIDHEIRNTFKEESEGSTDE